MAQQCSSNYEENPLIVKCLSKIYDEIVDIKNLLKLNKSLNNARADNPFQEQVKTGPAQLGNSSIKSLKPQHLPQQQQQMAHFSNNGSNHVHLESQPGLSTVPGSSSNTNSTNPESMNRPRPYPLHRPISQKQTLNSLKDLCSYEVDYRGLFNVMGVVHRLSPPVIKTDNLIKTNLVIVDQSMIEVSVTIIETKYSRKFYRGQVVMLKNAQMIGKVRRLKANTFQIEPNNEKAVKLHEWYSTNRSGFFEKINTTTINNDDDDDPFNQQQQQ